MSQSAKARSPGQPDAGVAGLSMPQTPTRSAAAAPQAADGLLVHSRAKELLAWLLPHVGKWPREHRHGVARHVSERAMHLHDALIAARHLPPAGRMAALRDADIYLDQLRQYLQLAWQWQWMSNGQFEHVSGLTGELGRLIGGWRRSLGDG